MIKDWPLHLKVLIDQVRALSRPLAVFTGQDNISVTLIEACTEDGISVPEEIAILGVDNISFLCECCPSPLSSIDCYFADLGYAAAEQLGRRIDGEITFDELIRRVTPGQVISRRSTDSSAVPHRGVAKALELMKHEFSNGLVLEDIYEHSGLSNRGLEKAFSKHLGNSPRLNFVASDSITQNSASSKPT